MGAHESEEAPDRARVRMPQMFLGSFADLDRRVCAERARLARGEEAMGPWRVDPRRGVIEHARAPYEVDLDRLVQGRAVEEIARAAAKEGLLTPSDVGHLVRLFMWLGYLPRR